MSSMQDAYDLKDADGNPVEIKCDIPVDESLIVITLPDAIEILRIDRDGGFFIHGKEVTGLPGPELGKAVAQAFFELQAAREIPPEVWSCLCEGCIRQVHQVLSAEALRRLGAPDVPGEGP